MQYSPAFCFPSSVDWAMDDLMDLLSYQCPFTGRKRIAGCEDGQLYTMCLGKPAKTYPTYGRDIFSLQGGAPTGLSWFINHSKHRYNPINPSYGTYKPT